MTGGEVATISCDGCKKAHWHAGKTMAQMRGELRRWGWHVGSPTDNADVCPDCIARAERS